MKVPVPDEILPADRLGRVHFVGIGGAGLSGIARIMLARGHRGQRQRRQGRRRPGRAARARAPRSTSATTPRTSHDADTVVVSTAVREDNPEFVEARAPRAAGAAAGRRARRR